MDVSELAQQCVAASSYSKRRGDVMHARCLALASLLAEEKKTLTEVVHELETYSNNLMSLKRAISQEISIGAIYD
jgi:hypothetical protein